jgi:hypothetical protein
MTISGTVQFSGRLRYAAPVPNVDSSSNPTWLADVLEQMACSARKEEEYTLTADGDTPVTFGSLVNGANWVVIKVMPNIGIPPSPGFPTGVPAAPNPVIAKLTSPAGAAAPIEVDGFMLIASQTIAYTALSIARTPSVQTTVRVMLFAFGS